MANGSFEDENVCTEYAKNCAPEAWICTSLISDYYVDEPTYAFDGARFIGLIVGSQRKEKIRTFARSRLLCALRKGKQYQFDFSVRSFHNALDSVGIYFSSGDFLFETRPYNIIKPSILIKDTSARKHNNSTLWSKQSLIYTATGDEIFFTIGSFKRKEYSFTFPPDIQSNYYIYLDKFSLTPVDPNEKLCNSADSIKAILYTENERHNLLDRKRYYYSRHPPVFQKPNPTIVSRVDTLVIPDILFSSASARLNEKSYHVLDSFSNILARRNTDSIVFEGHTDSVGTLAYNQKLSADRAGSVADYVTSKVALDPAKIILRFYAYMRPIGSNSTPQGRQRNRRV